MTELDADELVSDEDLLLDIGRAVASLDVRFAAVEVALRAPPTSGYRPRQRGRVTSALPPATLTRRRDDAGGITWSVWAFDHLPREEQVAAMHQLRAWVDWLNAAYELPLTTLAVPPCWYAHPGVVRELWALLGSYEASHTASTVKERSRASDLPAYWHDRLLWPCLKRLRGEHGMQECIQGGGGHQARIEAPIVTDHGFTGAVQDLAAVVDTTTEPEHRPRGAQPRS